MPRPERIRTGAFRRSDLRLGNQSHIDGLWALLAVGHFELHRISLFEGFVALSRDRGKVDEHIRLAVVPGDESVTLAAIKPLYFTFYHVALPFLFLFERPTATNVLEIEKPHFNLREVRRLVLFDTSSILT